MVLTPFSGASPVGDDSAAVTRGGGRPGSRSAPRGVPSVARRTSSPAPTSSASRPGAALSRKARVRLLKVGVWILGLTPLGLLARRALGPMGLGANPIEAVILHFGRWTLILLLTTLAVTPVRRITGWNSLAQARRPLGLFAFFYVCLHLLSYVGLDQTFSWHYILEDVVKRPFITVGMAAFVLLLPLAVTSTRGWIRRLGRRWTLLHMLIYPAAILGAIHFYWKVKADTRDPLIYGSVLAVLLVLRAPVFRRSRRKEAS